jgi:hypothetical protein
MVVVRKQEALASQFLATGSIVLLCVMGALFLPEVGQGVAVMPPLPGDTEGSHHTSSCLWVWALSHRDLPVSSCSQQCHCGPVIVAEVGQGPTVSHSVAPASRKTHNCGLP